MSQSKDEQTSIETLKDQVRVFCEARDWDQFHTPKDLAIGLITEASELLEHFRFQSPEEIEAALKNPDSREKIADELADSLFFVLRFAQRNGIDLSTSLAKKMQKSGERYPIEKARGSNRKYDQF